jgi:hypothetical protein
MRICSKRLRPKWSFVKSIPELDHLALGVGRVGAFYVQEVGRRNGEPINVE